MNFHDLELTERLLLARRGTSYFAQRLAEITDEEMFDDTLLNGWTRKHLLAHVAYNAAALCRLLDWAATGVETPMYKSVQQRNQEISEGATLASGALRSLFDHTTARLNEKWRHLPPSAWNAEVLTVQGRLIPASDTAWLRTREVWIHAVDLASGGRFAEIPDLVLTALLFDIVKAWRTAGLGSDLVLEITGTSPVAIQGGQLEPRVVRGTLPAIVRWAAGRGAVGVSSTGELPEPPRWL
jgi:maleylpyruvate isomerase